MKPTKREVRWAERIFETLFPATPEAPRGARDVPMGRFYTEQVASSPLPVATVYRLTMAIIYLMPLLVIRRLCTFGGLEREERERYLLTLYESRWYALRQTITLVKMIAGTAFLGFPEIQRQFGVEHDDAITPIEI